MGTGGKIQAVLTCQGDIDDPDFPDKCQTIFDKLSKVLDNKDLDVTKCEPWNSVKVTFNIPKEAAEKLARLAEAGDQVLRELGILSIQVEGGQVISMTMLEEDSDSDAEPAPSLTQGATFTKDPTPKTVLASTEEKVIVKQESLPSALEMPSMKGSESMSRAGLPFSNLLTGGPVRPGSSRESCLPATAALLMKNLPLSAGASVKPAESSVLSSFGGLGGGSKFPSGKESLLASLVSSRTSGKSDLFSVKDSDEPVSKKARKQEIISTSDNSIVSSGVYPFGKLGGGGGFTIHPVSSIAAVSRSLTSGSQLSSLDSRSPNPLSGSSVKLANLPGVSLTSVNRSAVQSSSSLSSRHGGGGLMPPPSSVTLSPVPRTNHVNNSLNERMAFPSETGDSNSSPGRSSDSSQSKLFHSKVTNKQTLLINPVTGQFEIGPLETSSEPETEYTKPSDPGAESEAGEPKSKLEPPLSSPGSSISTSGEPSLKLKLKVSLPNNSSKGGGAKDALLQSKSSVKVVESEPKLPKLKIKLKEKSVELENDEKMDSNSGLSNSDADESQESSVQLDLKTRVRIKPLPEKMRHPEMSKPESHFPSLNQINHISVDTNPDKKKKKDKGGKDRLAVWTESLAKHTKREDSGTKETKSWPELLENRLFSQGANSTLAFNKADLIKNQTDKEDEKTSEASEENHLNWAGPGREGAEPGPGHTRLPSPRLENTPNPLEEKELDSKDEDGLCKETGITSVLDILEGRRPLGDPVSPLGTQRGHPGDHGGQQGEDSGIESMDTLSEKSPNQGESPFHGGNDPCIEGSRVPTYSSSMGPVSGKMSPPVSDSGSTDSIVIATPPDKSPISGLSAPPPPPSSLDSSESKLESKDPQPCDAVLGKETADTQSEKLDKHQEAATQPDSTKPSVICDSKTFLLQTDTDISKVSTNSLDRPNFSQSIVLNYSSSSLVCTQDNISNLQSGLSSSEHIPEENGGDGSPADSESDLIRSYDGADDKCPGDLLDLQGLERPTDTANCLHDYANGKTLNHVSDTASNNCTSDCNIITLENGQKSTPASPAVIKSNLHRISSSISGDQLADGLPGLLTLTRVGEMKTCVTPAVTLSTVSVTTLGPGLQVRSSLPLRPGAKMVPVKLVSVPGTGVRMVRVSPVKGGEIVGTTVGSSGVPPRTVVIKSSLLKPISTAELAGTEGAGLRTSCFVRIPGPGLSTSFVRYPAPPTGPATACPVIPPISICDISPALREPSQTTVNPPRLPTSAGGQPPSIPTSVEGQPPSSSSTSPADGGSNGSGCFSSELSLQSQPLSSESPVDGDTPLGSVAEAGVKPPEGCRVAVLAPSTVLKQTSPHSELTNGDLADISEIKSDRKRSRNGKKGSGESDGDGGGSLLRPLIEADPESLNPPESPVPVPGKRSRRDTGSSVQSDKSDLSIISTQSLETAAKRGRRGSTSPGLRETSRTLERSRPEEKGKESRTDSGAVKKVGILSDESLNKGLVSNGSKPSNPKPDMKKIGRPALSKDPKLGPAGKIATGKPVGSPATPLKPGEEAALSKPDAARRVSMRGKKPEETAGAAVEKKKKR